MLTVKRKKQMRSIGHHLKPIISIGDQAISPNLLLELKRALTDHELIKVRIRSDRFLRKKVVESLCAETGAKCIQLTGAVALLFLAAKSPNPRLSNLIRLS